VSIGCYHYHIQEYRNRASKANTICEDRLMFLHMALDNKVGSEKTYTITTKYR
jgi:hypothetical protein